MLKSKSLARTKKVTRTVGTVAVMGAVAYSGFQFSNRSRNNLNGVCPPLVVVTECAIRNTAMDFMIIDGLRTDAEHAENLRKGVSWIKRSPHQDGFAIDVVAWKDGKISWNAKDYPPINDAFQDCAKKHNVPIIWGGDWRVRDWGHFELKTKVCFPKRDQSDV